MTPGIKPLIAGTWKMNGTTQDLPTLQTISQGVDDTKYNALICVPATLVDRAVQTSKDTRLSIGGQDCHANASGAHTGDTAAAMLADMGASHVIVGHSERRTDHGESDQDVRARAVAANAADMTAIVCVGETKDERESGKAEDVVETQLAGSLSDDIKASNTVVAYEPVWAIGTGLVPSADDIKDMHAHIRQRLIARFGDDGAKMAILYGGSLKPENAAEILAIENVDGGLIGGASLKSESFLAICSAVG